MTASERFAAMLLAMTGEPIERETAQDDALEVDEITIVPPQIYCVAAVYDGSGTLKLKEWNEQ